MFERRQVEVGERFGDRVQILRGLVEGEQVVASGTFLVDSESRLRSAAD
jgi:Cu(I)/Ag(I) efflux system membrane fusion protein